VRNEIQMISEIVKGRKEAVNILKLHSTEILFHLSRTPMQLTN
jgi:hypothetical protein